MKRLIFESENALSRSRLIFQISIMTCSDNFGKCKKTISKILLKRKKPLKPFAYRIRRNVTYYAKRSELKQSKFGRKSKKSRVSKVSSIS